MINKQLFDILRKIFPNIQPLKSTEQAPIVSMDYTRYAKKRILELENELSLIKMNSDNINRELTHKIEELSAEHALTIKQLKNIIADKDKEILALREQNITSIRESRDMVDKLKLEYQEKLNSLQSSKDT